MAMESAGRLQRNPSEPVRVPRMRSACRSIRPSTMSGWTLVAGSPARCWQSTPERSSPFHAVNEASRGALWQRRSERRPNPVEPSLTACQNFTLVVA